MKVEFNPAQLKEIKTLMHNISVLKSQQIITAWRKACLVMENRVKLNLSGQAAKVRSGKLRQSIGTRVCEQAGQLAGYIGSGERTGAPVVYANILEEGGVIRPKNKQWLTLPTRYAQTQAGAGNLRAREVKNGFFSRGKNGELILYQGGGQEPIPMFILRKQVKIPAKRYLALSVAQSEQEVYTHLISGLSAALEEK